MSRASRSYQRRRRNLDEQLALGVFPSGRYSQTEITKETVNHISDDRKQEGSPLRAAAPSVSSQKKKADLIDTARLVFPGRRKLYSIDVLGRRDEIDTRQMSGPAYQRLLEAFQNPVRLDDLGSVAQAVSEPSYEVREGCKIAPATGLSVPEWWELHEAGVTAQDTQSMIRRNLERAQREGRGIFSRSLR